MTAEQLAERIKNYYKHQKGYVRASMVVYYIEQIEKELCNESEDAKSIQGASEEPTKGNIGLCNTDRD